MAEREEGEGEEIDLNFIPQLVRGASQYDMLAGSTKVAEDTTRQGDGSFWASFCSTRNPHNCASCQENGQAAKVACTNPAK